MRLILKIDILQYISSNRSINIVNERTVTFISLSIFQSISSPYDTSFSSSRNVSSSESSFPSIVNSKQVY